MEAPFVWVLGYRTVGLQKELVSMGGWGRLQESVGAPARHLGTEDDELVELVEEGVPPSAALGVRLFHDQLRINLTGQTKGQSGSAVGLCWM